MAVIGHIDECGWDIIRGWAWDPDKPTQRLELDVRINDVAVVRFTADGPGADLADAGFGDGAYRFRIELQSILSAINGDVHDISVVEASTGALIHIVHRLSRLSSDSLGAVDLSDAMALHVLQGTGIEIGALNNPQRVRSGVTVEYVDRYLTDRLRTEYPEIPGDFADVAIVDDGAALHTIAAESYDFVIANNLIEHVEDPVAAMVSWTNVLRPRGVLFLIIPNRRNSVDSDRQVTEVSHFLGTNSVEHRRAHYLDWAVNVDGLSGAPAERRAEQLGEFEYSIHFHVWDELTFGAFLHDTIARFQLPLELEMLAQQRNRSETLAVLRKVK